MNPRTRMLPLLSSVLLLAVLMPVSGGIAATSTKDFPGGSPLIIPSAAFNNTGFNPLSSSFNTRGYLAGGGSPTCFAAPAYLPDGVRVTRLFASLVDMSATNMQVSLIRTANTGYRSSSVMASVITNGNTSPLAITNTYGTSVVINETVQYPEFSYFVFACMASFEFQIYQVEIRYEGDFIFGDSFEDRGRMAKIAHEQGADAVIPGPGMLAGIDVAHPSRGAESVSFGSPLNIAAAEFKPEGYQAGEVLISFNDGVLYGANYAATRFAHAPIYLPDGATITEVRARVLDRDPGGGGPANCAAGSASDIELFIVRSRGCSGAICFDNMLQISTSGSANFLRTLSSDSIDHPVVDGDEYGYFALIRLCGPKHEVHNLRVYYALP